MSWINTDSTYILLKKILDVCVLRHKVTANNIANVDTPGFKSRRVLFEEELKATLKGGFTREDLKKVTPRVYIDYNPSWREDLNNVDIEKEMVKLSINTLRYNIYVQFLDRKLGKIKTAIEGR